MAILRDGPVEHGDLSNRLVARHGTARACDRRDGANFSDSVGGKMPMDFDGTSASRCCRCSPHLVSQRSFSMFPKFSTAKPGGNRSACGTVGCCLLLASLCTGCCSPCGPRCCTVQACDGVAGCGGCSACQPQSCGAETCQAGGARRCCLTGTRLRCLLASLHCGRCSGGADPDDEYHHPYFHPVPTGNVFAPRETYDATAMTARVDARSTVEEPAEPQLAQPRATGPRQISHLSTSRRAANRGVSGR